MGGLETEEFICRLLCRRNDLIMVDVDYRLAPESPFPALVLDVYDVVKWVAKNSHTIGGDLGKGFILGGISAGGNATVLPAYMARDEGLQPPITGTFFVSTGMPHYQRRSDSSDLDLFPGKLPSIVENKDAPILPYETNLCYGGMLTCKSRPECY